MRSTSRRAALAALGAVALAVPVGAQGPDLVQVTFARAFGATRVLPTGQLVSARGIDGAVTAGRALAAAPENATLSGAFLRELDAAVGEGTSDSAIHVVVAIVRRSLQGLSDERAYLHMRLDEVDHAAYALAEQSTQISEASRRLTVNRTMGLAQVMTVRVDPRLFESLETTRTSCDPCFTQRMMRLGSTELEREARDAASVNARLLARRSEILQRGAEFNQRAALVVHRFAEALKAVDGNRGGAIRRGLH